LGSKGDKGLRFVKRKAIVLTLGLATLLSGCGGSANNNVALASTSNVATSKPKPTSPTYYFPSRPTAFEYNLYDDHGTLLGTISRTYTMISGNYATYHDLADLPTNLSDSQTVFLEEIMGDQKDTNTPSFENMSVVAQTSSGVFLNDSVTGDDSAVIRQMQKSPQYPYVPFAAANKVVTTDWRQVTVLSTNKTVKAGGTTFSHVIEVKLIRSSGVTEVIDYAPAVGLVKDTYYSGLALSGTMVFKAAASPNPQIKYFSQVSSPFHVGVQLSKLPTGQSQAVLTLPKSIIGGYQVTSLALVHGNQRDVNTMNQAAANSSTLPNGQFWMSPDGAIIGFQFTSAMSGQLAQFQITAKNPSGKSITGFSIPFIVP
jgi:hypothetical protein